MRFVHSSDWQIGKNFGFADDAAQSLREERLETITRLGALARAQNASAVLVAGDVYDVQTPLERTLRQPIERMRAFPDIAWHLIPGNHDPHTPRGPWERLLKLPDTLPGNVHLHLSCEPVAIADGQAWLLPAPLTRRHADGDPTAAMDHAATPEGAMRLGLAHGSITSFGTDPGSTHNLIAPDRPERAGLAYLALGDWHGGQRIGERCWYSGTPETDDFSVGGTAGPAAGGETRSAAGGVEARAAAGGGEARSAAGGGEALVIDIASPRAIPVVTRHRVGRFYWHRMDAELYHATDIDVLETRLRGLSADDLGTVLVWLRVSGALSLAERQNFADRIEDAAGSALRVLRLDAAELLARPSAADLQAIDHAGFVRTAADKLAAMAADPASPDCQIAGSALQRLYILHMRGSSTRGRDRGPDPRESRAG